jgi:hypothetical protein
MKHNCRAHPGWPLFSFSYPVFLSLLKRAAIFAALFIVASAARAQTNFFPLLNCKNRIYTNATIESVTPATATIFWDGGGERIPLTNLPPEILTRYHYDPQAAQEYLDAQAAKKADLQDRTDREFADLVRAQSTLGPAQKIRIVKIISDFRFQIEADGKVTDAWIHHLPPETLASFRELDQTKIDAARLEAQITQDHNAAAQTVPNTGAFTTRAQKAAARAQKNAGSSARTATTADTAALAKVKSHLKELESRATFMACPTDYVISGGVRLWEYRATAAAGLTSE